jgi:hypothetical protein
MYAPGINDIVLKEREVFAYKDLPRIWEKHSSHFPRPHQDIPFLDVKKDGKEWFCAYPSLNDMASWLNNNDLHSIVNKGFGIFILKVAEYQVGKYQIIYTKESIISKKNISQLFK